jgi:lysine-N-methylase
MPIIHRTDRLQALVPRYATRFACVGPECEDSCCSGWDVFLDKETYKAYSRNARLAPHVDAMPPPRKGNAHGRIALKGEAGNCPLLEEKLCGVQKIFGAAALSHTCFTYPRHWFQVDGQCQESLNLSCPEAARLALLAPDAFEFAEQAITVRQDLVAPAVARGFDAGLVNEVRFFCLNLVRLEGIDLWQRLALLGLFCESLDGLFAQRDNAGLRQLLDRFVPFVEQNGLLETIAAVQPDHARQALVFSTLWGGKAVSSPNPGRNAVMQDVARGLGADPLTGQVPAGQLVESYRRGVARLPQALHAAPHLLEHYLLNEMFQGLFPFMTGAPFDSYLQLVARFGLLRLMLAARCNTDGPLPGPLELARTVQVHCRRFQHDPAFVDQVNAALAKNGWASLERLYPLLPA